MSKINTINLEENLGYIFQDKNLLKRALTHSSYVTEHNLPRTMCNERLEFLGDSVLETVIREELYIRFPDEEEGYMTKLKSDIVRCQTLAAVARKINVGKFLFLGKGEVKAGSNDRDSILEDAVEAIIGAVFLEAGFYRAKSVVLKIFEEVIEDGVQGKLNNDYKSEIQRIIQRDGSHKIQYNTIEEYGLSHDKTFVVELCVDDERWSTGKGKTKKAAENLAAKDAIEKCSLKLL